MTEHTMTVRIYYEDTDCGGVVYYANYLKYAERARTELLGAAGISLKKLMERGIYFVVAEASLKYLSPGRYDDTIRIHSVIERLGNASVIFRHYFHEEHSGTPLVDATVKIACIGRDMKPKRMDPQIIAALG